LSKYPLNFLVTILWYVGGSFLTPNGITFNIKAPPICNKCSLVYVLWSYRHLMISWISI
jgi:hypothetical protein